MKKFFVAVLVLGLTACSDSKKDDKGGGSEKMQNVTDYGACGNFSPDTVEGSWMMQQIAGEFGYTMILDISRNYITVSNICDLQGRRLIAQVSGSASYRSNVLEIYSNDYDEKKIDESGFQMTCRVSMSKGAMRYAFKGRCLELSVDGQSEKLLLVPR